MRSLTQINKKNQPDKCHAHRKMNWQQQKKKHEEEETHCERVKNRRIKTTNASEEFKCDRKMRMEIFFVIEHLAIYKDKR